MSKTKRERFLKKNQAFFEERQKQQRTAKLKKPDTPFSILPLATNIKPGLMTTLLLFCMISASIADQMLSQSTDNTRNNDSTNESPKAQTTIKRNNSTSIPVELAETTFNSSTQSVRQNFTPEDTTKTVNYWLNKKMIQFPDAKKAGCNQLKGEIIRAVDTSSSCKESIMRTLKHSEFRLVCSPQNKVNAFLKTSGRPGGFFNGELKTMILSDLPGVVGPTLICHEFTHADMFFLHNSEHCQTPIDNALIPVYPVDQENIERYSGALEKGYQRIEEFRVLYSKQKNNQKLTDRETKLYSKYSQASQDCQPLMFVSRISKNEYQDFKAQLATNTIITKNGNSAKIIGLDYDEISGKYYVFLELIDKNLSVIRNYVESKKKIEETPYYQHQSQVKQLSEKDAYAFSPLSTSAMEIFFREAHKMRNCFF